MNRNLFKALFFPLFGRIKSKPKAVKVAPLLSDQVHVFAGTFPNEATATDYAMGLGKSGSLSADLGGAAIGPDDVEIIHGEDRMLAARPMFHFHGAAPVPAEANTFILLSDRGYDTAQLTGSSVQHIGKCDVS